MEVLIVLAVVWLVISWVGKSARRMRGGAGENKAKPDEAIRRNEAKETGGNFAPPRRKSAPSPWDQIAEMFEESWPRQTPDLGEGESEFDGEGCVGGTMGHDQHEGSYPTGSLDYAPRIEYTPVAFGEADRTGPGKARLKLTPRTMKSAVVMAEVLGRPVSLRE